jgi:hypothetical protein
MRWMEKKREAAAGSWVPTDEQANNDRFVRRCRQLCGGGEAHVEVAVEPEGEDVVGRGERRLVRGGGVLRHVA